MLFWLDMFIEQNVGDINLCLTIKVLYSYSTWNIKKYAK